MKTITSALLISASLLGSSAFAAGPAPSGELDYPPAVAQTSTLSRADVVAQLHAAQAAGRVTFGENDAPVIAAHQGTAATRAEVKAAARDARVQGPVSFSGQGYPQTGGA